MKTLAQEEIAKFDKADMLGRVLNMPQYFQEAWAAASAIRFELKAEQIKHIVVAGMGGSAISGELAKGLTYGQLPVPLMVCRSYNLPQFVNRHSLVVVSSYSGDTEETFSAFEQARRRGAQIVCITSGGKIGDIAQAEHLPLFSLPGGFPPRSALVYLLVPLLKTLRACGFIPEPEPAIKETIVLLEQLRQRYHPAQEESKNMAKRLARALSRRLPLIYAAEIYEAVAWRWKEQFCENAKVLAWYNVFPELNHNELVGWGLRRDMDQHFQAIYLSDRQAAPNEIHPCVHHRMDLTRGLIEQSGAPVIDTSSEGQSLLARFFSLIFLGDMASVYLAVLNGTDPTPVEKINYLKNQMAQLN